MFLPDKILAIFQIICTLQLLFIKYKPDVVASFGRDDGRRATNKGNEV